MARKHTTAITVISKISEKPVSRAAAMVVIHGEDQDSVSRNHAKLVNDEGRISVEDLGSTNGTIVNDEHIEAPLRLRNGDLVKIGRTIFKFIASNNIEAAYHDEIYRMTTVDGLTQVFNRRYFEDAIERELSRARRYTRPLSLVMIDIDHFKKINDSFGHLAGDAVLKEVASTIRTRTRREDVLARYGGEEFALLLPEVDVKGGAQLAEKVRKLVEKHTFTFDGEAIPVSLSAGVATVLKKSDDSHELIRRADEKLYEAKSSGRNRVAL
jgi:two-component system, cell cycle response regulator